MCLGPPPKLTNQVRWNGERQTAGVMINKSDNQRLEYKLKEAGVTQIHVPQQRWKHQELGGSVPPTPQSCFVLCWSLTYASHIENLLLHTLL